MSQFRRDGSASGVVLDDPFALQVMHEGARPRQFPRHRRPRLAGAIEGRDPVPNAEAVELRGGQLRNADVVAGCHPREVLGDVDLVGAHGVRRDVSIQLEEPEKRLEMLSQVFRHVGHVAAGEQPATAGSSLGAAAAKCHGQRAPSAGAPSQSCRSASARSAIRDFFAALSRGGFASGSMMPKVMFDGW